MVFILSTLLSTVTSAATLSDNFNGGLSPALWDVGHFDAAGVPWTIEAPDANGQLRMFKQSDLDMSNLNVYAIIDSRFVFDGDFLASVGFNLVNFPLTDNIGWNEAMLRVYGTTNGNNVSSLRLTDNASSYTEGFANLSPYVLGELMTAPLNGRLLVSRVGENLSAFIDSGSGPVLLGSISSPELLGPMKVQLCAAQIPYSNTRPTTALDVRFDDFVVTADTIVPEPSTLILLDMGAFGLLAYTWRRRK
jgi:hypothetical protein